MGSRRKARIIAVQGLYAWEVSKGPLDLITQFLWLSDDKRERLKEDTLPFASLLITGTVDNSKEIDAIIQKHLKNWKLERLDKVDLSIMRLGAYSLLYQKDIPGTVSIDEAVGIAKEFSSNESYKFINGVLDAIRKSQLQDRE
ncbi:MAG: transcription antitermination factor NusB [Spirochaetia bacterium]